jgi:hyperosmotically inducible periplasmic protein
MEDAMRIVRALLTLILIAIVAFVAYTYLGSSRNSRTRADAVGTSGKVDVNAARERGAEVGEKMAVAAEKVKESAAEAALTSKIKAKMMLDDFIKARTIDVTTNGTVVTMSGTVRSVEEHDRAIRLAHETSGVSQVVDHLRVAQ